MLFFLAALQKKNINNSMKGRSYRSRSTQTNKQRNKNKPKQIHSNKMPGNEKKHLKHNEKNLHLSNANINYEKRIIANRLDSDWDNFFRE